jgi:hypothetical protein
VVSKFEKRLIQAAKEAVAFARDELAPRTYRVHTYADEPPARMPEGFFREVETHRAGEGGFGRAKKAKSAAITRHKKKHPAVGKKKHAVARKRK